MHFIGCQPKHIKRYNVLMTTYIVIFITRCLQINISSTKAFFRRTFRRTVYQICIKISFSFSDKYQLYYLGIFMYANTWYELFYYAFSLSSNRPWNLPIYYRCSLLINFTPVVWVYAQTCHHRQTWCLQTCALLGLQEFHVRERLVIEHVLNGQELKPILTHCCIPHTLYTELCYLKSILQCLSLSNTDPPLSLWFVH